MRTLTLTLTLLVAAAAAAETVYVGAAGAAAVRVLSDGAAETVVSFQLGSFERDRVNEGGQTYDRISLPDVAPLDRVGLPELPAWKELLMVPGDARVRAEVVSWEEVILKGYNVWPLQTLRTDLDGDLPFVRDEGFYAAGSLYPAARVTAGAPGVWRDIRVADLTVYPIRFDPATRELHVATRAVVKLVYYDHDGENALPNTVFRTPAYEPLYRDAVLNYRAGLPAPALTPQLPHAQVLFICYPDFVEEMEPLATFYNKLGHYTKVVTTNETGTTDTAIKAYIQDVYDETTPPTLEYVLLAGDIDYVAAGRRPGKTHVADYMYSLLTGGQPDPYPDIAVGRFSTKDGAKITHFVDKTVLYQDTPPLADNWLNGALLVAHKEDAPGKYEGCCEEVRTYDYAKFNPTFTTVYGSQGKTNADISAAINAGQNIASYRGHGSATEWWQWNTSNQSYMNGDFHGLANGDKTSIILNIACDNADLDYGAECLAEAEMNASDGAVSINGASDPSYTVVNHDYMKELFKAIYDQGILPCGMVSNYANGKIIQKYSGTYLDNVYMYLWNGDPYAKIWLKKPAYRLTADHPTTFTPGGGRTFTVTVTSPDRAPVDRALVGLYKKDDIYAAGFTGPDGKVTLAPAPILGTAGTMYVTASKDGALIYWGECAAGGSTAVAVDDFAGRRIAEGIKVTWNARGVSDLVGFNLYRRPAPEAGLAAGPGAALDAAGWVRVNETPVRGRGPYSYLDAVGRGAYQYQLEALTRRGGAAMVAGPLTVGETVLPRAYALNQSYPNPARDAATIAFALPEDVADADVRVYDLSGRRVRDFDLGPLAAGEHKLAWDLTDGAGRALPAGIYLYRLETPEFAAVKRMVVAR